MKCANHPDLWAVFTAKMKTQDPPYETDVPICGPCGYRLKIMGYELTEVTGRPLEPDGTSTQVIAGSVSAVSFRLETMLEEAQPGFAPEELIGLVVQLNWPAGGGTLRGTVESVEPYVDAELGPGHWVTMKAPS